MRAHVFIVNEKTLPKHLQYNFVGTSSKDRDNNISLLADMERVKKGDLVFFYIEGLKDKKGRFFGVYKVVDDDIIHCTGDSARSPELPVKLIYRRRIEPYEVFPIGIPEWEALDKLPRFASELFWTLIYRKMKGKRGNTMLFPWETERLLNLIRDANNDNNLNFKHYSFDENKYEICEGISTLTLDDCDLAEVSKAEIIKSESHLQAFLLQNINVGKNDFLPEIFGRKIIWLGNEVFAGSGMQKIDILTIEEVENEKLHFRIIELKHPKSVTNVTNAVGQLEYYINWAREDIGGHLIGSRKFNVKPILLNLNRGDNSVPDQIIQDFNRLKTISFNPEIWEIDSNVSSQRIL